MDLNVYSLNISKTQEAQNKIPYPVKYMPSLGESTTVIAQ